MLDTRLLPASADVQSFLGYQTVDNLQWQTWRKPRGVSMLYLFCVGSGAGGGGGFTRGLGTAGGGGGGGGSSSASTLVIPAALVPDILYIQVGVGGSGVSSGGGVAGSGLMSYISCYQDNHQLNCFLASGAAAATGGGTGTAAAIGALGSAGTVPAVSNCLLSFLGVRAFGVGRDGTAGGAVAGAVGGAQSFTTGSPTFTMGGTGGAGTTSADFAGGLITNIAGTFLSERRPPNAAAGSNNGPHGYALTAPFFSFPGMGGGSSNTGVGGLGGNGGPGSGGGGGGAGTTGGKGGDGGPGLVIITAW